MFSVFEGNTPFLKSHRSRRCKSVDAFLCQDVLEGSAQPVKHFLNTGHDAVQIEIRCDTHFDFLDFFVSVRHDRHSFPGSAPSNMIFFCSGQLVPLLCLYIRPKA